MLHRLGTLWRWIRRVMTPAANKGTGFESPGKGFVSLATSRGSAAEGEEQARTARLLVAMALSCVLFAMGMGFYYTLVATEPSLVPVWSEVGVGVVTGVITLLLVRRGRVTIGATLFAAMLWLLFAYEAWRYGGVRSPEYPRLVLIPVFFGLLLGRRAAIGGAVLSAASGLLLLYAEAAGLLPAYDPAAYTPLDVWATRTGDLFLVTVLLYLADRSLRESLLRTRRNEQALAAANRELAASQSTLQQQAHTMEQHATQLEVLAEVGRVTTSTRDIEPLLWQIGDLIQRRLGLYHVGFFLFAEDSEGGRPSRPQEMQGPSQEMQNPKLEYRAGSGEAGRLLRGQGLAVEVGGKSSVSDSVADHQVHMVPDVRATAPATSASATLGTHSLLPAARAEVAIPLLARLHAIGAVCVVSEQPGQMDPQQVTTLKSICDQVAAALDSARLFRELEQKLEAERRAYGEVSRETWLRLLRGGVTPGYRYREHQVDPLLTEELAEASPGEGSVLTIPIRVRGEAIGNVDLVSAAGRTWTTEDSNLLATLSDQLGVALDSARLYEETQRRGAQERLTAEVVGRVRETLDIDLVLQAALREIGEALDLAEAVAWVGESPPDDSRGSGAERDGGQ